MYYVGDWELENKDVILSSCELCIDTISNLPIDVQYSVLNELFCYLTEK